MFGANHHARRLQSKFDAMCAEMAFRRRTIIGIDIDGIVGAGLHARLAADASVRVEIDNAVFALIHRGHRADGDTRRIFTVIAAGDLKNAAGVGKRALFDVLHPSAIYGEDTWFSVLHATVQSVTADTLAVIDDESVLHSMKVRRE